MDATGWRARVSEGHGARSDRGGGDRGSRGGSPKPARPRVFPVGARRPPAPVPADRRPSRRGVPSPRGVRPVRGSAPVPPRPGRLRAVPATHDREPIEEPHPASVGRARVPGARGSEDRGRQHRPGRRHARHAPLRASPAPAPPAHGARPPLLRGPPGRDDRGAPRLPPGDGALARRPWPRDAPHDPRGDLMNDTDVRDLLARVADEVPVTPVDPEPLLRRGYRRMARTAVAGAVGIACAIVVAVGGVGLIRSSAPTTIPADRGGQPTEPPSAVTGETTGTWTGPCADSQDGPPPRVCLGPLEEGTY